MTLRSPRHPRRNSDGHDASSRSGSDHQPRETGYDPAVRRDGAYARLIRDERGLFGIGLIVKLLIAAVIVIAGYDAFSVGYTNFRASDDAANAARIAANALPPGRAPLTQAQVATATVAAQRYAVQQGDLVVPESVRIGADRSVTLTVQRTAPSVALQRIPAWRHWTDVSATATAEPALR